jgi:hypothetical protein
MVNGSVMSDDLYGITETQIRNLLDILKSIISTNEKLTARIRDLEIRVDQLTRLSEPLT